MLPYLKKFTEVIDKSTLAKLSKVEYKGRLQRLTVITGHDVDWIIHNCKDVQKKLKSYAPTTQKGYINTVLTVFKYTKDLKKKQPNSYKCWFDALNKINLVVEAKYDNIEPSQKQLDTYVSWDNIIKRRETLNNDSQEYLLLSMYTMIPPARADMNHVKIYHKEPSDKEIEKQPNYLIIKENTMRLIYNEFKSRGRKIQRYEKELPENLKKVIINSLEKHPREYLIVSPRTGEPYENAATYTKYFDRMLHKIFDKAVTINTLRHSFVNALPHTLTPGERDAIARELMHDERTMQRYRLILPEGNRQECKIVCNYESKESKTKKTNN